MQTAIRPFTDTLREIRNGDTQEELAVMLNQVVAAVRETGKVGELTLKLKIKPAGSGVVNVVQIEDTVTAKMPELPRPSTLFFPTEDNNLQRTDPRQRSMELEAATA